MAFGKPIPCKRAWRDGDTGALHRRVPGRTGSGLVAAPPAAWRGTGTLEVSPPDKEPLLTQTAVPQVQHAVVEPALLEQFEVQPDIARKAPRAAADDYRRHKQVA